MDYNRPIPHAYYISRRFLSVLSHCFPLEPTATPRSRQRQRAAFTCAGATQNSPTVYEPFAPWIQTHPSDRRSSLFLFVIPLMSLAAISIGPASGEPLE